MQEATYARKAARLDPVLDQAAQDDEFRARLLRDTRGTLGATLAGMLPQDVDVRVVEDDTNVRHIVLPYAARPVEEEIAALSELADATPAVRALYTRAFREPEFRASVLRDPRPVLEELLRVEGQQLPKGIMFRAVEETEKVRYIVLPPSIAAEAEEELSDNDLDLVAGGATGGGTGRAISRAFGAVARAGRSISC
jgi:hypothetical protein